jgi:SagB-type dehydrogenase family enzyme
MSSAVSPPFTGELPPPQVRFTSSVEEVLRLRRSIRAYRKAPVSLGSVAQLLWAAQGVTDAEGHRTVPSAGAVYPLEACLIAGDVDELEPGVYRYVSAGHRLEHFRPGDVRRALARACLDQEFIAGAALSILLVADERAMQIKYGDASSEYIAIEVGCALQNMALQAVALDLGSVIIGAFHEPVLIELLGLGIHEKPASMLTIGHPQTPGS